MKTTHQRYTITDQYGDKIIFSIDNNHRGEVFSKCDCRHELYDGRYYTEYKNEDGLYNALRRLEKQLDTKSTYFEDGF